MAQIVDKAQLQWSLWMLRGNPTGVLEEWAQQ